MKKLLERKIGLIFTIIQILASIGAIGMSMYVGFIPGKYIVLLAVLVVFFLAYTIFSQISDKSYMVGRVLSGIFIVLFVVVGYYEYTTYAALDDIAGGDVKVDQISYIVLKDDPAESIADAKEYPFGILENIDVENTQAAIAQAEKETGITLQTTGYEDTDALIEALYSQDVKCIVFNEAFRQAVEENHATFAEDTKIVGAHEISTDLAQVEEEEENVPTDEITTKPFNVYISGIDCYGKINQTSRSDVNLIATVNPVTKQVLLTSTPRDFYVEMANSNGMPDKLTHAGMYGVDNSVKTLEMLYGIEISYYVRVNFTSLKKIVNNLGGVTVYSDYTFTSDWGPKFKKGYNEVNGKQALAFCRERHHFTEGDRQRVKNHQHMFEAILSKVMSPTVLPTYPDLLTTFKKMVQTNMSTKKITALASMQLNDNAQWKISSYSVNGSGARKTTYSYRSRALYVMVPDQATVDKAKKKINKVLNATVVN